MWPLKKTLDRLEDWTNLPVSKNKLEHAMERKKK